MDSQLKRKSSLLAHPKDRRFGKFKQDPESGPKCTMDDFWIRHGWHKRTMNGGFSLTKGKWEGSPNVRRDAIRFLAEEVLKKDPRDMIYDDFYSNRLSGLMSRYYNDSPYEALRESGYDFHPWEMSGTQKSFYEKKKNRIEAITWLVQKIGKDPRDMIYEDFRSNRLSGLILNYYNGSPYDALREAGYRMHPWEMLKAPNGLYHSKKNRIKAVTCLVKKLRKKASDMTQNDFRSNRLCGLLANYYNDSPYEALRESGLVAAADEKRMRGRVRTRGDSR